MIAVLTLIAISCQSKEKEQLILTLEKVNQLTLAYSPKKGYDEQKDK